ncbi:hypothetical protein NE865_04483 [Phthorimaea operculella]|nr:hypothetical protein NE865_04483 [Phthorimaea operculella]
MDIANSKTKLWKENIEKLLYKGNVCGICLAVDEELDNLNTVYYTEGGKKERTLEDILGFTFGVHIVSQLPTHYLCEPCITTILRSYFMVKKIRSNHRILQKYIDILTQQAKISSTTEQPVEKQLLLTIDNVKGLNVPGTVTKKDKQNKFTQIFLCEVDASDDAEPEFDFENSHEMYECPYCGKQYEEFFIFKNHYSLHNEAYFRCHKCSKRYKYFKELIGHRNQKHFDGLTGCNVCQIILLNPNSKEHELQHTELYTCVICELNFQKQDDFETHNVENHMACKVEGPAMISSMSFKREHECDICGCSFNSEESYTVHRKNHETNDSHCRICNREFMSIGQLNVHVKNTHPEENPVRNITYRCTMCPLDFKLRTELLKHIPTHPKDTPHTCRQCNESCFSKKSYISHVRKHRIKYDKSCPICFKKYTKHTISRHLKLHRDPDLTPESAIVCDVCSSVLPSEKDLIKHASTHEDQRQCPHCMKPVNSVLFAKHISTHMKTKNQVQNCSDCNYTTKFAVCLEAHINRYHLKIRPYVCDLCNKTFYSDYTLKGHKATHKEERPELYCNICQKKFISQKAVMLHTRIHTGEQPYPCDLCELSFISASRRQQHKIRKHFEPQFECQICYKKLYTQSDLKRHIGDSHDGESRRKKTKSVEPDFNI